MDLSKYRFLNDANLSIENNVFKKIEINNNALNKK